MRSLVAIVALVMLLTIMAGCVQPRYGRVERQYYDSTVGTPEKHWWARESQTSNVDIDDFTYRWNGLLDN